MYQKYKLVFIPLIFVLFFDVSLLAANFYISSELETATININIAGRQRMLSQRIMKSLMLIHFQLSQGNRITNENSEMVNAVSLFHQTLSAFINGGVATSASGETILIQPLADRGTQETLIEAERRWKPLHLHLEKYLSAESAELPETQELIYLLSNQNLPLLALMNNLTNQLESQAKRKAFFLRTFQTIVVVLIFLSFIMATFRLYRRENYYNQLMEKSTDVVISVDIVTQQTTFVSSSCHEVLGYTTDRYLGDSALLFFTKKSRLIFSEILGYADSTGQLEYDRCEIELLVHDGTIMVADMVMQIGLSENGKSLELTADIRDISERKEYENALAELAHKDSLTGLLNRMLFIDLAEHSKNRAIRSNSGFGILFIDLDGFKSINDSYGHNIGDEVLIEVARRLRSCSRLSDSVARYGGDEFIVLCDDISGKSDIDTLVEKIMVSISQDIIVEHNNFHVGASIGYACYPEDGEDINTLIMKADSAMYEVKKAGKESRVCA